MGLEGKEMRKMDRWRWVRGGRGMGRGRKKEVPKLPSSATGLVYTMAEPWVGGWF